jgi:hypothetical protein
MATPTQRPARSGPGPFIRIFKAWRALGGEQRLSAIAAASLWITMFLPWYSESPAGFIKKGESAVSSTLTAWGAFSWVEAAVLVVSVGVLFLLFARGERRAFHLPGGDGFVIMLAGGWAALLIIYRMFDKTSQVVSGLKITPGNEWGIFCALFAALWLAWTGLAMRRAHRAEPALADDPTVHLGGSAAPRERRDERAAPVGGRRGRRREEDDPRRARRTLLPEDVEPGDRPTDLPPDDEHLHEHRGVTREDAEQLSFELPEERHER